MGINIIRNKIIVKMMKTLTDHQNFFFGFQLCTLGPIGFLKNIEAAARSKPSKKILMVSESVHHFYNNVISDNIYSHVILSNK